MARLQDRENRIAASLAWLERYDPLIDDRAAFRAALDEPPPVDLLVPPGRAEPTQVQSLLATRGLEATAISWAPHHLRVATRAGAGTLPEVVLGYAHPQGVASAAPVLALAPKTGERLLDLCAAPGGKTLYLATSAGDRARLIAADAQIGRTGPLVQTLTRHGIASTTVVAGDSSSFPSPGRVDAILLDAPCSGEGTFRIPSPRFEPRGAEQLTLAPAGQRRLLARAADLLRPGGRLVYATCALAPEENEAVLADLLDNRDDFELLPLPRAIPGLPGVASWNGRPFGERMRHARRLLPHHTGSWGFFVALLQKGVQSTRVARTRPPADSDSLPAHDSEAFQALTNLLRDEFGVDPTRFGDVDVFRRGRDLWLRQRLPVGADDLDLSRLRVVAPGLRAVHVTKTGLRPTTSAIRWLGTAITQNVVDLSFAQVTALLSGEPCAPPPGLTRRPRALAVDGFLVGTITNDAGTCRLHLPSGWR